MFGMTHTPVLLNTITEAQRGTVPTDCAPVPLEYYLQAWRDSVLTDSAPGAH